MRQLPFVLCATLFSGYAFAGAPSPLLFTLDLGAPCNQSGCSGSHPTDINLDLGANSFNFTTGTGGASGAFISELELTSPVICGEVSSANQIGPSSSTRFAPKFTNPLPGGLLEFDAGGPSIVDITAVSYDGDTPAGVAAVYSNYGASGLPPQVGCYKINPITGGPVALAGGPSEIFRSNFETLVGAHFANEPWVSVRSVFSPHAVAGKGTTEGVTSPDAMGFVVEVHNATQAIGWRLDLGYDYAFFDPTVNGVAAPLWCVLDASVPQPGPINGAPATCGSNSNSHVFVPGDIQAGKNSIFVYVEYHSSVAAINAWQSLSGSIYPAVAAIFPPFGTYPQRFDDKVAVASANNLPTFNIGSIICANNTASTSCTINDQDGHPVPAALTFTNAITSGGTATIDPIAYLVDPTGNSTLPGNSAQDAISVSNVSCSDPNGILAGGIGSGSFATSAGAQGARKLGFTFTPSAGLFTPGTATCTATFTAAGFAPQLSSTQSFTITMQQANVTHFLVTAPAASVAGASFSTLTVTALDGADHAVGSYNGTVHFSSTDLQAILPPSAALSGGTGTFTATLKTAGSQTFTASDASSAISGDSNAVVVAAAPATHFRVQAPGTATAGNAFNFAVTALDQFNNTDDAYAGFVHFTSGDGTAILPSDGLLTFGLGSFNATLNTTGPQTVTATDTVAGTITGTSAAINVQ